MSENNRRNFLKGVFAGLVSTGLVVSATPKEIEVFARPLIQGQPLIIDEPMPMHPFMPNWDDYLYDVHGNKVAMVREVRTYQDIHEFHRVSSFYPELRRGGYRIEIIADGIFGRGMDGVRI